jgi:hypothetical protein
MMVSVKEIVILSERARSREYGIACFIAIICNMIVLDDESTSLDFGLNTSTIGQQL